MNNNDMNNNDMNNNDKTGKNTEDLERRLREVLHREAETITPRERRTEIVAMAHDETQSDGTRRRWLIPAAAAASVALIGTAIWGVSNTGGSPDASRVATSVSTAAPTDGPTTAPTEARTPATVPAPNPSSAGGMAGATTQVALPAYFVGASSTTGNSFGLYREFVRTAVPAGATPAQKAKAAVTVAMSPASFTGVGPKYLQPWSGTSVTNVGVTPSQIAITLSGPGASGLTAAQSKLAVQQLVWTAQAAVGQGNIPVKFAIANGSPKLFGSYPTAQTYNRPPPSLQYEVLAPIWITSPARAQVIPAGRTVVAAGQSCAFEGTTQWQLKRDGTTVKSGFTTASSGCPTRGTWQVKLGVLAPGSYIFRMYEESMQDGQVIADTSRSFSAK